MGSRWITVGDDLIERGTSIYHETSDRLLWFQGIEDGSVKLESVDSTIRVDRTRFEDRISDGTLIVESDRRR